MHTSSKRGQNYNDNIFILTFKCAECSGEIGKLHATNLGNSDPGFTGCMGLICSSCHSSVKTKAEENARKLKELEKKIQALEK